MTILFEQRLRELVDRAAVVYPLHNRRCSDAQVASGELMLVLRNAAPQLIALVEAARRLFNAQTTISLSIAEVGQALAALDEKGNT